MIFPSSVDIERASGYKHAKTRAIVRENDVTHNANSAMCKLKTTYLFDPEPNDLDPIRPTAEKIQDK